MTPCIQFIYQINEDYKLSGIYNKNPDNNNNPTVRKNIKTKIGRELL